MAEGYGEVFTHQGIAGVAHQQELATPLEKPQLGQEWWQLPEAPVDPAVTKQGSKRRAGAELHEVEVLLE